MSAKFTKFTLSNSPDGYSRQDAVDELELSGAQLKEAQETIGVISTAQLDAIRNVVASLNSDVERLTQELRAGGRLE
jgi:hypothetical protein